MSTRALYTFIDNDGQYHVYKHHDGYPSGALEAINNTLSFCWDLPRFEADEFAASFVAANKKNQGGVRLTTGETWQKAAAADIEYHYTISEKNGVLQVQCDEVCKTGNGKWAVCTLKKGSLAVVSTWAAAPVE